MVTAKKRSRYRIVPTTNEKFGKCWALKEGTTVLGTYIQKSFAEKEKLRLETKTLENFLLVTTKNQELSVEI